MAFRILVGEKEFQIEKTLLVSKSDYFHAMLTGGMSESDKDFVEIKGVGAEIVEKLINYVKSNDLALTKDTVADILGGAVYFQIKSAISVCEKFLVDSLTRKTWLSNLELLKTYGLTATVKTVHRYVIKYMMELVDSIDHGQVPLDEMHFMIENWQGNEHNLFLFIISWLDYDRGKRKEHGDDLLSLVRYGLMPPLILAQIKQLGYQSKESPDAWYQLVDKAIEYHSLPLHQRVLDKSDQTKVRSDPTILRFPSWLSDNEAGLFFHPKQRAFFKHEQLRPPKGYNVTYSGIQINNFLIVLLELIGSGRENWAWYIFDPRTLQWAQMASLPLDLAVISLTHDGTYLYAPGGNTENNRIIDRVDRYDCQTNKWSPFSCLAVPTKEHAACVLNSCLYTSGGFEEDFNPEWCASEDYDTKCLNIMHGLDLTTLEWKKKASMPHKLFDHKMYSMKILGQEVIVLIHHDFELLYYSPPEDQWLTCRFTFNKPNPSLHCRPIVYGNRVYVTDLDLRPKDKQRDFGRAANMNQHVMAVITFPEEGKEATVKYLYRHHGNLMGLTRFEALSFCPDTCIAPPYKGGTGASG